MLLLMEMKTFLVLVLSLTALYVWQRNGDQGSATQTRPATQKLTTAAVTPGPVSEHNWAKHSLDRTHEVMDQVQQGRRSNEQP
jgi:hypothetical protein